MLLNSDQTSSKNYRSTCRVDQGSLATGAGWLPHRIFLAKRQMASQGEVGRKNANAVANFSPSIFHQIVLNFVWIKKSAKVRGSARVLGKKFENFPIQENFRKIFARAAFHYGFYTSVWNFMQIGGKLTEKSLQYYFRKCNSVDDLSKTVGNFSPSIFHRIEWNFVCIHKMQ